jgi:hypothetical protein
MDDIPTGGSTKKAAHIPSLWEAHYIPLQCNVWFHKYFNILRLWIAWHKTFFSRAIYILRKSPVSS